MLLNQLPLLDLPKTLITSLVFLYRVHPIILYRPTCTIFHLRHGSRIILVRWQGQPRSYYRHTTIWSPPHRRYLSIAYTMC
jgi:hypothetical protein